MKLILKANGMTFAPNLFMAATINTEMAARLKEIARLLDEQGANQFRVRAYRRKALYGPLLQHGAGARTEKDS
jgi:hypothetical protein